MYTTKSNVQQCMYGYQPHTHQTAQGGGEANMILTSVTSSHCSWVVPAEMVIHILVAMVMST